MGDHVEPKTIADNRTNSLVEENALHKFASYNYVLTLSALSRRQLDNPDGIPTDIPHDIIARTGGIGNPNVSNTVVAEDTGDAIVKEKVEGITGTTVADRVAGSQRILSKGRDIYFNSVSINSVPRPNEFRKLMNYTKIEMQLEEPNGITFWEKCRAAAFNNGYMNHTNAPFLLTIEFKGYDSNGIALPNPVPKRTYPIRLSKSSLQMNAGSTTYTVQAYPWTEFAMINAFLYTRTGGQINGQRGDGLNGILKKFADDLNNDMLENEVKKGLRQFPDKYEITADPEIGKIESNSDNQYPVSGLFGFKVARFSPVRYDKNNSIAKILEDLVRQYDKYNNIEEILFRQAKASAAGKLISEEEQYVSWYKIVTTIKEDTRKDKILNQHPKTIRFHIKEFKIHILNFVKAGFGFSFDYTNAIRRKFNYIYTGENLDILDLNVEYNAGYFQSVLRKSDASFPKKLISAVKKKVRAFFGDKVYTADPLHPLSQYITTLNTENPNIQPQNEETGSIQSVADAQYDYLVNPQGDMVTVEMKIMGDPAFLGHDYAIPFRVGEGSTIRAKIGRNVWDPQLGAFNFDNGEVVVQLNFKFPSDFDENTALYKFNSEATPQFTGLYRIVRTESNFDQGQFTQTLTMARCNNQRKVTAKLKWSGSKSNETTPQTEDVFDIGGA
mgnify:FL=1